MPMMKSLRSFRLASTSGHIYQITANEPIMIDPVVVPEAMQAGCVPVDAADTPFYDDLSKSRVEFEGDLRRSLIYMAIDVLVTRNDANDFAAGVPKAAAITERIGALVSEKEARAVYQLYTTAKSEGRNIELHQNAHMVMRVLEADDRNDLVALGKELSVPAKEMSGMSARDLRKLLLTKLNGIATE